MPGQVEIVVWCHDPETRRQDLVVPLSESGTGIGQVLAILYVVLTSERPQTILIDEPQSFLHPGAARKLIDFLKLHQQHQFIIATHSPTIIAATNPKTITLATFDNGETTLQQLDVGSEQAIQRTLTELGIRLSDVFGADSILWVEGRTEEKCFPLIVEKLLKQPLLGVQILGIRQTGDLEGRDAKKVFEIYRSLSSGPSLLPPAIAFVLDDEGRNEQQKTELSHQSENKAFFLKRRMYECYLLNPSAIAAVANKIENFREPPVTADDVSAAIDRKLQDRKYFDAVIPGNRDEKINKVRAGKLLEDLFQELSETHVMYQKIVHGVALTEWLIENAPEELDEVVTLLRSVLKSD